jgi:hypothetical protein
LSCGEERRLIQDSQPLIIKVIDFGDPGYPEIRPGFQAVQRFTSIDEIPAIVKTSRALSLIPQ